MQEHLERLTGTLINHIYREPDGHRAVASFKLEDGSVITAVGDFANGIMFEVFILYGFFEFENGDFHVTEFRSMPPVTTEALPGYLAQLSGVSIGVTSKLVQFFGEKLVDVLHLSPHRLPEAGIPSEQAARVVAAWEKDRADRLVHCKVDIAGISPAKLAIVQRRLGPMADINAALREDPFLLYLMFDDLMFAHARRIAGSLGVSLCSQSACRGAAVALLRRELLLGHTFIDGELLRRGVSELLGFAASDLKPHLMPSIKQLMLDGFATGGDGKLQLKAVADSEVELIQTIKRLHTKPMDEMGDYTPSRKAGTRLLEEYFAPQDAARLLPGVSALLAKPFAFVRCHTLEDQLLTARAIQAITAGFGADTVFTAYYPESCARFDEAMPGSQVISYSNLVGYDPATGIPTCHEGNPLECDVLVVVMADCLGHVELARALNTAPLTARVYVLGCASIINGLGQGQPFYDLTNCPGVPVLDSGFWYSSESERRKLAQRIATDRLRPAGQFIPGNPISWLSVSEPRALIASAVGTLVREISKASGCSPFRDIRISAPTIRADVEGGTLNAWLEPEILRALDLPAEPLEHQALGSRKLLRGFPYVFRQSVLPDHQPEFSSYVLKDVSPEGLSLESMDGETYTAPPPVRIDVFSGLVLGPKLLKGRICDYLIVPVLREHHHLYTPELMALFLNSSSINVLFVGELEGMFDAPRRPVEATRTLLPARASEQFTPQPQASNDDSEDTDQ